MKFLLSQRCKRLTFLAIGTMLTGATWAQLSTESIVVDGDTRTFLQYLPTNFSPLGYTLGGFDESALRLEMGFMANQITFGLGWQFQIGQQSISRQQGCESSDE